MIKKIVIAAVLVTIASPSFAAGTCSFAPASEFKDASVLQAQLEADGLTVRRIKLENGCYEVYAVNASGDRINAAFNAKTFEQVDNAEAGEG